MASGRSSPYARGIPGSANRSGGGQPREHIPGTATSSCEDTRTHESTDPAKRDAEGKIDGDEGGSVVGRLHHPRRRRNPSLRIQNIVNRQGGDEFRIPLGSSNNRPTRKSLRRDNRNAEGRSDDDGPGMGAWGHKEVGTQEGSHSINRYGGSRPDGDGGGTAVSHAQGNHSAINGSSMGQPEDDGPRMAPGNHNFAHAQAGPCLADKKAESHPKDRGPGIAGSNSYVIQRWENPDSAGGRAASDPSKHTNLKRLQLCSIRVKKWGKAEESGNC